VNERDAALAELLLTMADDEFVVGYWDSEWTGIAPMLEEDVAMSSLAQDEIGHAQLWLTLRRELTGEEPDAVAYGRTPAEFRHARLLDHPRNDWAFSVCRRWLYDTADAVRLEALARSTWTPLADAVAKVQREERYHLMHLAAWMRRLAAADGDARARLVRALEELRGDAASVFTPLAGEDRLVRDGVLSAPMRDLEGQWLRAIAPLLHETGIAWTLDPADPHGRTGHERSESFKWLWNELTSVARLKVGAAW
jgi:ring-1,2-phenylacetyl-CoA epoxidase subunit PaaC